MVRLNEYLFERFGHMDGGYTNGLIIATCIHADYVEYWKAAHNYHDQVALIRKQTLLIQVSEAPKENTAIEHDRAA